MIRRMTGSADELLSAGAAALRVGDGRSARDRVRAGCWRSSAPEQHSKASPGPPTSRWSSSGRSRRGSRRTPRTERRVTSSAPSAWPGRSADMYGTIVGDWAVARGGSPVRRRWSGRPSTRPRPDGWRSTSACSSRSWTQGGATSARRWRSAGDSATSTLEVVGARLSRRQPASTTTATRRGWCCSTRRWPRSPAARSTTSSCWRRSSASCSRRASTPTTSPAPTSGSASARRSPSAAACRPCRRSAAPTTAASSPPPDAGRRPTPRSPRPCGCGDSATARPCGPAPWSASPTCASARVASRRPSSCSTGLDADTFHERHAPRRDPPGRGQTGAAPPTSLERALDRARPGEHRRGTAAWRCSSTSTWPRATMRRRPTVAEQLLECASRHPSNHYLRAVGRAGPRAGRPGHRRRRSAGVPARGAGRLRPGPAADGAGPVPAGAGRGARRRATRRWRWPRRGPRSRRSSGCRPPATPTPPTPLLRSLGVRPTTASAGRRRADPARGGGARPPRPRTVQPARSPSGCSSAARRSSTTSATSSPSSACAAGPRRRRTPSAHDPGNQPPNRGAPRSARPCADRRHGCTA